MSDMKAIVVESQGKASVQSISQPKIRPEYIKVKVQAVALNPTDWKHIDFVADAGAKIGCDFAGEVLEVGDKVTSKVSKGEQIWGFSHGGNLSNHEDGCFSEYALVKDYNFGPVPKAVGLEAASTFGVGIMTVGQGMYQSLGLPWPNQPASQKIPVLIYGGSTATGMLAVQFAKLSGLTVITTASKHNFDMLKSFGADEVFDYSDSDCGKKIREYTQDKLYHAFDCISEKGSPEICADALASKAPSDGKLQYSSLLPVQDFPRKDVENKSTLAYTTTGEAFSKFGMDFPPIPENREFAKKWLAVANELTEQGKIKAAKHDVRQGGLEGVLEGLDELRKGKVSGVKLVYTNI